MPPNWRARAGLPASGGRGGDWGLRLDKYLQVARLVRRRAIANALCDAGQVQRNGRVARASTPVAPGDLLQINDGRRVLTVRVLRLPEGTARRPEVEPLYERVEDHPPPPPA